MNRRQLLAGMGSLATGFALLPLGLRARGPRRPRSEGILKLAEQLRRAPSEQVLDVAAKAIADGAVPETLLGAIFLEGLRDIRPRPHGILHTVMMVESAFQLSAAARTPRGAWYPALFNLQDLEVSRERDRAEDGDYQMKPLAKISRATKASATRDLLAGLEEGDADRAERAGANLVSLVDADTFFELLRPYSARCYAFIGHKAIYAVQLERVVRRIGWRHAEPAARSLVRTLLVDQDHASFERVRALTAKYPADWQEGSSDAARALGLLERLRGASPERAPEIVLSALEEGACPADVFDALSLLGSEIFHRRPGRRSADRRNALLPVHGLTVVNALRSSFLQSGSDATRRLLLLQAASWVTALRDDLGRMVGLRMEGLELGSGGEEQELDAESVLKRGSPDLAYRFLQRSPDSAAALFDGLSRSLARVGREHHQHKYAAAMWEEAGRVSPALRARVIAPALDYLAHPADEPTDYFHRAEQALDRAGVPR